MSDWLRRIAYYLSIIGAVMLAYALVYHYGMLRFEGEPVTFLHSLQVVVETFTTTGFGSDAPWTTPAMNLLVIVMDLTGVFLIFLALPVLVFPLLQDALSTTPPTAVDEDLTDHVIICSHTPRADALIAELDAWAVDHVIVEPSRDAATDLYEAGYDVIHAEPDSVAGLEAARLGAAKAVVADVSDTVDTSIVLTAKELASAVPVVSIVEEPDRATYHELAGADVVLSPRTLLGESLATKVTTAVTTDLGGVVEVGDDFDIAELSVHRGSELVGSTLAESGVRERTGVNVIGLWLEGEFQSPPDPDTTLERGTVLLVTGRADQLERLKELTVSDMRRFGYGETVVVGLGEVGRSVVESLEQAGLPHTVVDRRDVEGVDVVGDATTADVLRAAGVPDARTVLLALPDDTAAEFATLVVRDLNPSAEIIARAEGTEAVRKIYRAGADYVLSLATVSGRMTASAILEDEDVISLDTQVDVIRTRAPELTGRTAGEAGIRERTGCTVVAVERGGTVITDVGPEFRFQAGDELVIAGTDEGTNRFTERLG